MKEKSCHNCDEFAFCWNKLGGKDPTEVCENWNLSFREYEKLFTVQEIFRMTDKEKENRINSIYK